MTLVVAYPALVGATLTHLRTVRRLRQIDVATPMGLVLSSWSRIEAGLSALSIDQLSRAARLLGVAPAEVLAIADRAEARAVRRGVRVMPGDVLETSLEDGFVALDKKTVLRLVATAAVAP